MAKNERVEANADKFGMSVTAYAKRVGIGINKMFELSHYKGFPVIKIGRKRVVIVKDADDWLREYAKASAA